MTRQPFWNRRTFLQRLGYCSALGIVPRTASGLRNQPPPLQGLCPTEDSAGPMLAYVANWEHGIQVFAVEKRGWRLSQTIASDHPSWLALHPSRKFLYAVNELDEYDGLPRGTVEAYGIGAEEGRLTLLNRQLLSLSAITPRYLAVSPDGSNLVVAVHGGGSYNVLPIRSDGYLDGVSGILKAVGSGPDRKRQNTSHPQMVLFEPSQRHLISADLGSDSLNVFSLAKNRLHVAQQHRTEPGCGPGLIALHPSGGLLYVANGLNASVSCFAYDAARGRILDQLHHQPLDTTASLGTAVTTKMAMHPTGNFLVTSYSRSSPGSSAHGSIASWRIDSTTGKLDLIRESNKWLNPSAVENLFVEHNALFLLSQADGIFRVDFDSTSGLFGDAVRVANVSAPKSMVLHYL
jgi:6-phosphogluconolactonase